MTSQRISGPAYRVHTPRLVIRCWDPADAPLLKAAIDASLGHLRPWMPWARSEPQDVQSKVDLLRHFRGEFDLDRDLVYGVLDRDEREVLGGTGLHPRVGAGALEIGYWIHAAHINQGLATEVAAALTKVAFEANGVDRVEIHNDPANVRSAAVPRKLGFVHEATLCRRVLDADGAHRDAMVWTLFAHQFPDSPAASAEIEAFDAMGRRVLPRRED
jgi:RimJ/RimL family protein N-acetyltransferase